ncbi:acetyl/propionyl/methylcrotonyl-CoA carboxylase subunit alpha [Porticoccaceae bacterium]|nr:acetyl/propionyl/methylcrotonyl-CoA carboxylase subunit alpha [Porticoccaceae bacterium]MDB9843360.1 acetyl/propionyl/methylcrotonyl-CoA carboxylase subunit alpha [Porticoccaceae bacterium]MDC0134220.1 acetyl/propionyl/methylcrotonyl-CoA carboxylase subunit alpha [Porticoccaceae bacterium]
MFTKILIANRGEIACRIIKTAKAMGVATVAVYSEADRNALHVQMADESVAIGPSPSNESYLVGDKLIQAALDTGAEAIHPGYGFLSENAEFCRLCAANNLVFIGPPVEAILAMGSKSAAKTIMADAGVPLVPGYHGDDQNPDIIKQAANNMGYPVLLKAAAGGGGKGMRAVYAEAEFDEALAAAKREALNSFNDDIMLVEKYLLKPRHVEIQVFCDRHNNAVYLFERDCSVQRRHQKVIEEAPAPGMTETLRQQMGEAAIKAALAINYEGAGTVEFLLDAQGEFFFMEMNTRLQVEHPVTEMISGQDLVEWQLRVASGELLPRSQDQLTINGHAFEARIYAEDPDHDFLPATGRLTVLQPPLESAHVRVDTGVVEGDDVSIYYDPMIAKLIVWDTDRDRALQRLTQALSEYRISGLTTNIGFLYNLAISQAFQNGDVDTGYIEEHEAEIFRQRDRDIDYAAPLAAAAIFKLREQQAQIQAAHSTEPNSPWHLCNSWGLPPSALTIQIQQAEVSVATSANQSDLANTSIAITESGFDLFTPEGFFHCSEVGPDLGLDTDNTDGGSLRAPMNGTVVSLLVETGTPVSKGDTLLVMEAMKMEHTIDAPADGMVTEFYFQPGDLVDGGADLLAFEGSEK